MRRQLNYFSFVRVGKGRQRESTYINEAVVELDDILQLKRRPASAGPASGGAIVREHLEADGEANGQERKYVDSVGPGVHLSRSPKSRQKRRRTTKNSPLRASSSPTKNLISEDENSEGTQTFKYIALDWTKPVVKEAVAEEDDVLAGCSSLLGLSKGWA